MNAEQRNRSEVGWVRYRPEPVARRIAPPRLKLVETEQLVKCELEAPLGSAPLLGYSHSQEAIMTVRNETECCTKGVLDENPPWMNLQQHKTMKNFRGSH